MRAGFAVLGVLIAVLLNTGVVTGHADLIRAEPAVDSRLAQPPAELTLHFSQGLKQEGSFVLLEDDEGERLPVSVSFDASDNKVMRAALGSSLGPSVYTVLWQTLSADDDDYHDGNYQLIVLNPDGSAPDAPPAAGDSASDGGGDSETLMLVLVTGLVVVGVGGLAFFLRSQSRQPT